MNMVMMKYMIIHFISQSKRIKNPNDRELKAESKLDASKTSIFSYSFKEELVADFFYLKRKKMNVTSCIVTHSNGKIYFVTFFSRDKPL